MLILIIVIAGVVLGYLGSLRKKRFPTVSYVVVAWLGATIGAFLSIGDSAVYLKYSVLNAWTMPIVFSAVFVLMAMLADKKGVKRIIAPTIVLAFAISGIIFSDKEGAGTDAASEEANQASSTGRE